MALPTNPLIPIDGAIVVSDNTGTPITLTMTYEDGDLNVAGLEQAYMEVQVFEARGVPYAARNVRYKPIEFSFTAHLVGTVDASDASILAALLKLATTPWASATSQLATAKGDAYMLQVKWTGERTNFGGSADASLTLKYCRLSVDIAEGVPTKLNIKGTCYRFGSDWVAWT